MTATLQERALELHAYLINEFGLVVTLAIYLSCATLGILALWRMVKLSFDIIRCVAIPAAAVSLVGAWLSPLSFLHILPVATALFAGLLLLRG